MENTVTEMLDQRHAMSKAASEKNYTSRFLFGKIFYMCKKSPELKFEIDRNKQAQRKLEKV